MGESKLHTFNDGWAHLRMLLILSPHLTLLLPGIAAILCGLALCAVSMFAPEGLEVGSFRWLPIFLGPLLLILGAQAALLGAVAAHRSDLTPTLIRDRLRIFGHPRVVDLLLRRFLMVCLAGLALNAMLVAVRTVGIPGPSLLGLAGLAQAAIVVGIGGIVSVLSADFAIESLWREGGGR